MAFHLEEACQCYAAAKFRSIQWPCQWCQICHQGFTQECHFGCHCNWDSCRQGDILSKNPLYASSHHFSISNETQTVSCSLSIWCNMQQEPRPDFSHNWRLFTQTSVFTWAAVCCTQSSWVTTPGKKYY